MVDRRRSRPAVDDAVERSSDPVAVRLALDRIDSAHPSFEDRVEEDPSLRDAVIAVCGASRSLTMLLEVDAGALDILSDLEARPALDASNPDALRRWKGREYLRIAARDLMGLDELEVTVEAIAALGRDVLQGAASLVDTPEPLVVVGMGKLGGNELNYASDIDVMFVGDGDGHAAAQRARALLEIARRCFRVDVNLRPQGRDGPLVRTLASYEAYWDQWADAWEFQALIKARAVAGDPELQAKFDEASASHLWRHVFSADDLRAMRTMKARVEQEMVRKGLEDREVKRGRGGIRDIEFAVQLLQLVHGGLDAALRSPNTLVALREMAAGGYVDQDDASALADAYCYLRKVEHRLQMVDELQVHSIPDAPDAQVRLARTMGYRDTGEADAVDHFFSDLGRHQATVRSIHERLYFRPLLEAFAALPLLTRPGATEARLAAFGFTSPDRARVAVRELTSGLTRSSRLMQQMLPLLLDWLADSPDPDQGLLSLRKLASGSQRSTELASLFRDSPEAARRVCALIGASGMVADAVMHNPDLIARLPDFEQLRTRPKPALVESARKALAWRDDVDERQSGLRRWKERHLVGITARDVLGEADVATVGRDVSALAEASLEVALEALDASLPFAVIALGRFGGAELSYASDLDVLFVYEGPTPADFAEAEKLATAVRRFVGGATPSARLWEVDADLRPEGKQGPLARSVEGFATYFSRWALVWERQAMIRARPVAGDMALAERFMALLDDFVWGRGLSDDEIREIRRIKARVERERIPPTDDPKFHLKLGRGSLSDIEFTAQLLQLQHDVRAPATITALDLLREHGVLEPADHATLIEAYRFCERTRNRLFLTSGGPSDALPQQPERMRVLARALDTTPTDLREDYRRVTRRSRAVMERLFYGRD
jgi:glutamate-ammonia-ligase adenylyltransferase